MGDADDTEDEEDDGDEEVDDLLGAVGRASKKKDRQGGEYYPSEEEGDEEEEGIADEEEGEDHGCGPKVGRLSGSSTTPSARRRGLPSSTGPGSGSRPTRVGPGATPQTAKRSKDLQAVQDKSGAYYGDDDDLALQQALALSLKDAGIRQPVELAPGTSQQLPSGDDPGPSTRAIGHSPAPVTNTKKTTKRGRHVRSTRITSVSEGDLMMVFQELSRGAAGGCITRASVMKQQKDLGLETDDDLLDVMFEYARHITGSGGETLDLNQFQQLCAGALEGRGGPGLEGAS